jgi:glutamate transport system permease protein
MSAPAARPVRARRAAAVGPQTSVLYDAPGPRTRRVTLLVSVVATVLILALLWLVVVRPLRAKDQLTMQKWGPLVNPADPSFVLLWHRLGQGVLATLTAAVLAIVSSLVAGTLLAVLRIQLRQLAGLRFPGVASPVGWLLRGLTVLLNALTRVCVEVFRGLPVVITIFFVARGLPQFGLNFSHVLWYLVIGLTIYNMVVIAEILRSGMEGLPRGQREAAASIGLSPLQTTRMILLPQSYRIMLPALISQLVVVLKDTSLGFIISYEDLLNVSRQAAEVLSNPIQMYFAVGALYLAANYSLSKLAVYLQRRLARGRGRTGREVEAHAPASVGADAGVAL